MFYRCIFSPIIVFVCIVLLSNNYNAYGDIITDKGKLERCDVRVQLEVGKEAGVEGLRSILRFAEQNQLPVSIAGSRHSQGGHTFSKNGVVIDLSEWDEIKILDEDTIRVQAGATWKKIIEKLNPLGLSVMIMQSDYDFSVGGTISVNAHGWQANKAPFVKSIKGLHLMLANGDVIYCDYNNNKDLFLATVGGYGLMGIVIDVDLQVIPNFDYNFRSITVNASDFLDTFHKEVENNPKAELFYGRFSLDAKHFLDKLIIGIFEKDRSSVSKEPLKSSKFLDKFIGTFFDKTHGSNFFKKFRWNVESNRNFGFFLDSRSRNQILYHTAEAYINRDRNKTDILQEYFIPIERFYEFAVFLKSLKGELRDLMNITIRHIKKDDFTLLKYAREDVVSFVMFFRIPLNVENDERLKVVVQKIIDKVIELGGSYYLPYRPYPRLDQFGSCYAQAGEFLRIKKEYDPLGRFQNCFYSQYLSEG